MMKLKSVLEVLFFKNTSLLLLHINCFVFQNVHPHIMEIIVNSCVPGFKLMLVVIANDCSSNYHIIMTMTVPEMFIKERQSLKA
jgi:hypothetical protein